MLILLELKTKNFKNKQMKKITQFLFMTVVMLFTTVAFSQSTVKGKVLDSEMNAPLPGANVVEKGTTNGTTTDFDGNFTITTQATSGVLVITYVGYGTISIPFNGDADLGSINMVTDNSLDEIVIVGSGIIDLAEDRETPIAVSTVTATEIQAKAVGNVEFPEVMKNTPSVYVSNQAGGFGDSQMF